MPRIIGKRLYQKPADIAAQPRKLVDRHAAHIGRIVHAAQQRIQLPVGSFTAFVGRHRESLVVCLAHISYIKAQTR